MSAFGRILSGIPDMDRALDNIRLGDNVVFRVTDLEEFKVFVRPLYAAIFENECTKAFRPEMLKELNNTVCKYCAGFEGLEGIMGVYDV